MPQETLLSKILSGLKRRGRKPQSRRKKIRLPFSGKIKAIASKLINSKIPDLEKLAFDRDWERILDNSVS